MPRYHFNPPSPVDTITFVQNDKGTVRAYLHAGKGVTDDQLAGITLLLRHYDFDSVPYTLDGKAVLEVRNFGNPQSLLKHLQHEHIVEGDGRVEPLPNDTIPFKDKLSKRTLQLSGVMQMIGDVGYYNFNKMCGHTEGELASYFYGLGTLALVGYGRNDQSEIQIRDLAKGFEQYLSKQNIEIPKDCSLHDIAHYKESNPLLKAHHFFKRYPSETYNILTGIAGAMVAFNAYRNQYNGHFDPSLGAEAIAKLKQVGLMDVGLGLTTVAATTYGTLVKEKKHDGDEPEPASIVGRAVRYARNNPLSVTGAGLMISTGIHALSTIKEYMVALKANDLHRLKTVPHRGQFVAANLVAEILIMMSSKGHGHGVTSDDTVNNTAYKMAAEVILSQPAEQREYMTNYIADFLEQPDVLAEKRQTVLTRLNEEIQQLKDNPWLCQPAKRANAEHFLVTPESQTAASPQENWQSKVSQPAESSAIRPSLA